MDGSRSINSPSGQPPTVWMMDEDGSNREALTVGLNIARAGTAMVAGRRASVRAGCATPSRKLSFAWLDVCDAPADSRAGVSADRVLSPSLSPDGREIAFHVIDEGGVINVWTQSVDGGPRKQVTFDTEAMSYPTWSPDGQVDGRGDQARR